MSLITLGAAVAVVAVSPTGYQAPGVVTLPAPREPAVEASQAPAPTATPAPSPTSGPSGLPTAAQWAALRECESGGNYSINTGNGYYGAYQFALGTWQAMGGTGLPSEASPAEQDARALALYRQVGAGPWPVCGAHLG